MAKLVSLLWLLVHVPAGAARAVVVNTTDGPVSGYVATLEATYESNSPGSAQEQTTEQQQEQGQARFTAVFKGIPYAAPPLADLRWRPPHPAKPWHGEVLDATEFKHNCMQDPGPRMMGWVQPLQQLSEDCLYLNVYAPLTPTSPVSLRDEGRLENIADARGNADNVTELLPVIVWIYGGGFQGGGGNETRLNGTWVTLLKQDVVIVTFNYRLNIFGFLAADELRERDTEHNSTGNYGIQDQRAVMKWVQRNIEQFGGDKDRVMLVGQSAGADSVSEHMVREASWGLFATAGLESGAFYPGNAQPTVAEQMKAFEGLLLESGCDKASDKIECLLSVNASKLLQYDLSGIVGQWTPTIDGVEISEASVKLGQQGKLAPGVPMLIGSVSEDIAIFGTTGCKPDECDADDFYKFARLNVGLDDTMAKQMQTLYSDETPRPGGNYTGWFWAQKHAGADAWAVCPARRLARWSTNSPGRKEHPQDAYLYYWTYIPEGPNGKYPLLAHHACEQPFVFHVLDETPEQYAEDGGQFHIAASETEFSHTIVDLWTSFARSKKPTAAGVNWPAYTVAEQTLAIAQHSIEPEAHVRKDKCDFWDELFKSKKINFPRMVGNAHLDLSTH